MQAPRLRKVKMPNMELYNGTTNPKEHLGAYKAQMYVQNIDGAGYCLYFLATLKRVAQKWLKTAF